MQPMTLDLEAIHEALAFGDVLRLKELLEEVHPQEILEHWEDFSGEHQYVLLTVLSAVSAAEVFIHLPADQQLDLLGTLPPWRVKELLTEISLDDLADLFQAMQDEEVLDQVKELLDPDIRLEVEALSRYQEDQAGGLMTPEYVAIKASTNVAEVMRFLRRAAPKAETIYYLYVIDEQERLKGVLSLRELIIADPRTMVSEIMNSESVHVRTDTDQEEVARLMADYDLTVLPVVDLKAKLVGIVTIDDVVDVLEEEATEDIYRLGAVEAPELVYSRSSAVALWYARVRWLVVLILTGMLTSSIMAKFESVLHAITALSFYLPVLLGTGGNTGNQSSTLIIRALATRDLDLSDWFKVLLKELVVGLLLGLTLAVCIAGKVLWDGFGSLTLGVAVSLALLVMVANLAGALLPLGLRRLKLDPALISNPLIATVSDVSGLLIYLSIAQWLFF